MAEHEDEPRDWDAISIFRHKYKIPSFKTDQSRWDKKWEKTLRRLSASQDVFPVFLAYWSGNKSIGFLGPFAGMWVRRTALYRLREAVLDLEEDLKEEGGVVTAWLLLDETERKRHLFNGMKETCERVSLHYDGRALCPEITTTAMLKQHGKAFTDFARDFVNGTKEAGPDTVYFLKSDWWSSAVNMPEPRSEDVEFVFSQLSLQRNQFISNFIVHTLESVLRDLSRPVGSPSMNKAIDAITTDSWAARILAMSLSSTRDRPLVRCENCTKTQQEIGGSAKFMLCSNCKYKLDFVVHYCSRACQKDDWCNHKKHCGKEKIAKELPGTIHDRSWRFPNIPEHFRANGDREMTIANLGFGTPHPSRPHSSALQRQLGLLESDKDAEYYLFDDTDRPIRVELDEIWIKVAFRMYRSQAMFAAEESGVEEMAEFLIKIATDRLGLSRARVLAQFEGEYGGNVVAKVEAFEAKRAEHGYEPGGTYLERMSGGLRMMRAIKGFPTMKG